jgi:hypothetical protein
MMKMKLEDSNGKMLFKISSRDKMKLSNISVTNWRVGVGKSRNSTSYSSTPRQRCQHQKRIASPGGRDCGIAMGDEKMRRPCFPEETRSVLLTRRVKEVKGISPEGIGAKPRQTRRSGEP